VPLAIQEPDTEGSALDIVDNAGAWDRFIELEIFLEEATPYWEGIVEDERLEEDKA